jgi:hypothetical protein
VVVVDGDDHGGGCWVHEKPLRDDDLQVSRQEATVALNTDDGDDLLESDQMVVSAAGNTSLAAVQQADRRRREEGWTDLSLDLLHLENSSAQQHPNQTAAAQSQGSHAS